MSEAGRAARSFIAACAVALGPSLALAQDGQRGASALPVGPHFDGLEALRERALASQRASQGQPRAVTLVSDAPPGDGAGAETPPKLAQAYACLIGGTTATLVALGAGAENLVNTISGGVVVTQNQAVLFIGVVGIVFASFCAIGQAVTPVYLYYTEPPHPGEPGGAGARAAASRSASVQPIAPTRVNFQVGAFGDAAAGAARRIGSDPAPPERPVSNAVAQVPVGRSAP